MPCRSGSGVTSPEQPYELASMPWAAPGMGGRALQTWLEEKGCQLDSSAGPAYVERYAGGSTYEGY